MKTSKKHEKITKKFAGGKGICIKNDVPNERTHIRINNNLTTQARHEESDNQSGCLHS